jgi:hypothetical protein
MQYEKKARKEQMKEYHQRMLALNKDEVASGGAFMVQRPGDVEWDYMRVRFNEWAAKEFARLAKEEREYFEELAHVEHLNNIGKFAVGQQIEARWKGNRKYCAGRIEKVHDCGDINLNSFDMNTQTMGTIEPHVGRVAYTIIYDGAQACREEKVQPEMIRVATPKKKSCRLVSLSRFLEMSQAAEKKGTEYVVNIRACTENMEGLSATERKRMQYRMKAYRDKHKVHDGGRLGWKDGKDPKQKQAKGGTLRTEATVLGDHTDNKVVMHEGTMFDDIFSVHVDQEDHFGDVERLYSLCQGRYATTVTREAVKAFLSFCPCCSTTPHKIQRRAGIRPMCEYRFNRRVQMDVVDMQKYHKEISQYHKELVGVEHPEKEEWKQAHLDYERWKKAMGLTTENQTGFSLLPRYMVTIFDHASKLRRFYAAHTKTPAVLGKILCNYAAAYGGFDFLHTDNGSDVLNTAGYDPKEVGTEWGTTSWAQYREDLKDAEVNQVLSQLRMMLPHVRAMQGAPYHSQSQGGVENSNKYGQKRLCKWMKQHRTLHWWMGLDHLNYQALVSDVNASTKMTPCEFLFGRKPPVTGLANIRLHKDLLAKFVTESVAVGYLMLGGPEPLL